jgi:hypothetical protein
MVTSTRKIVSLQDVKTTLEKYGFKNTDKAMKELTNIPRKRAKPEPPPTGSIAVNAAAIKYGISHTAILKWTKIGKVLIVKETKNCKYVNEDSVINSINNSKRLHHIN